MTYDHIGFFTAFASGVNAVISIFALSVSFYVYRRDRVEVSLHGRVGKNIVDPTEVSDTIDRYYLEITVTNSGRRSVTITSLAGNCYPWWGSSWPMLAEIPYIKSIILEKNSKHEWKKFQLVTSTAIPVSLHGGDCIVETFMMNRTLVKDLLLSRGIYAIDSTGKTWKLPAKFLSDIKWAVDKNKLLNKV